MNVKNWKKKGENISSSILLFGALQDALNFEKGGEISNNLLSLYDFCQRRLTEANINNDIDAIDDVIRIVKEIKEGWDAIPADERTPKADQ